MSAESASSSVILGHGEALSQIIKSFDSGRMHHAWLIAGIEGIGKATLASQIAVHIFGSVQNPLGRSDLCYRIEKAVAAETHPDLLVLRRAGEKTDEIRKVIVVEDALKISAFLRHTATHGGWRVVIVDEAHTLNRHAQNAILKILEEPPKRTLILMTATTPGALLPTIRSRCRVLHLSPLDDAHMREVLACAQTDLSDDEVKRLIMLSGGSIGFALQIVRSGALPLYDELLAIIEEPGEGMDVVRLHKFADQMNRKADSDSFEIIAVLLVNHLRHAARIAAVKDRAHLEMLLRRWDKVSAILSLSKTASLDRKLAIISAVTEIRGSL